MDSIETELILEYLKESYIIWIVITLIIFGTVSLIAKKEKNYITTVIVYTILISSLIISAQTAYDFNTELDNNDMEQESLTEFIGYIENISELKKEEDINIAKDLLLKIKSDNKITIGESTLFKNKINELFIKENKSMLKEEIFTERKY